jgi:hypothetical protein
LELGPFFERDELIAAVQFYGRRVDGALTVLGFVAFCRAHADDEDAPGRLPLSYGPIYTLYRHAPRPWLAVLRDAGLEHRASPRSPGRRSGGTKRRDRSSEYAARSERLSLTAPPGDERRVADAQRLAALPALRAAADACDGTLTDERYDAWAQDERAKPEPERMVDPVPSSRHVFSLFGSWPGALLFAGLCAPREVVRRSRKGRVIEDEELYRSMADALIEVGLTVTPDRYQDHREELINQDADAGRLRTRPSEGSIRQRIGGASWPLARTRTRQWMEQTGYRVPELRARQNSATDRHDDDQE